MSVKWVQVQTMFQGINRYTIKNFFQEQHKLEIKNDNFFVRGYMVADNAGDSYDMTFTESTSTELGKMITHGLVNMLELI